MLFGSASFDATLIWIIVLIVIGLGVKKGVDNVRKFYGGAARAVYNSPFASAAARQAARSLLHRLFR